MGGWPVFRMNNKLQFRRAVLLLGFLGAAFAGLGYRLVDLQVLRHDELSARAQRNTQREFRQAPRRGDILDATGNILATSVPVKTVCADPSLIGTQTLAVAQAIAPLLQLDEAAIAQRLAPRSYLTKDSEGQIVTNELHYVRLAKNVPEPTWERIYAAMTNSDAGHGGQETHPQGAGVPEQPAAARGLCRGGPVAGLSQRFAGRPGDRFPGGGGNQREWPFHFPNRRA